ncbi:MAG: MFS transporter [Acidimicrobiales bacterium]|nr:MFS transporter [Acidimicrobiales bacterium]MCB9395732.1 MFS transporter [Acidimicrobiaceae bacterium]
MADVAPALSPTQMRWLMGGLMVGLFVSAIEQSIVATALPTIAGELGSADQIAWVVSVYLLTSTVVTPLYGKMSDLFGRRVVYRTALTMFAIGSVLCAVAPSMGFLVAARAVQGLGGGGLMSLAFVIVGDVVSPRQRGRWIGLFTTIFTVSAVIGPLVGGLLVDGPGWRWVFWAVVLPAVVAIGVTSRGLRLPFATRPARIDWLGIALLVIGSSAILLLPIWGGDTYAWGSVQIVATAAVALVATVAFVAHERGADEPVVPMHLFGDRTAAAIFTMGFLLMGSLLAVTTFLPLFLQVSTGASATRSGLMLIPQSVGISVIATVGGNIVSRTGRYKWALVLGPMIAAASLLALTTIDPDTGFVQIGPILLVMGFGLGMVFPNLTLTVQNAARFEDLGVATSTANFFRSMGGAFGAAIGGAVVGRRLEQELIASLGEQRYADVGGAEGLIRSPETVRGLSDELQGPAVAAVAEAVVSMVWWSVPAMALMAPLALLVRERPLRTSSAIGGVDA